MKISHNHRHFLECLSVVEKKGVGHPDSLADMIAEQLSWDYTKYGLDRFGHILNHNLDKIVLSGGTAELGFGFGRRTQSITCHVFGKAILAVAGVNLPFQEIAECSVSRVFDCVFGKETFRNQEIRVVSHVNDGVGGEHVDGYYCPASMEQLKLNSENICLTDTAFVASFQPLVRSEQECIEIERFLNAPSYKIFRPQTGWDVKVMHVIAPGLRKLTVCVPIISESVSSEEEYIYIKSEIKNDIEKCMDKNRFPSTALELNTKDVPGRGYLTLFGTALDKGDVGVTGRGNKACGIISMTRPNVVEAVSGKNPVRSTGFICKIVSEELSKRIWDALRLPVTVYVGANNGCQTDNLSVIVESNSPRAISSSKKKLIDAMCEIDIGILFGKWLQQSPVEVVLRNYEVEA